MTHVNKWTTRERVNSYHSYRFPLLSTRPVPSVGMELIALISCVGLVMVILFIRDCDGTTDNGQWLLTAGCNSHRDSGLSLFANLHLAEAVNDSSGMAMIYSHWERPHPIFFTKYMPKLRHPCVLSSNDFLCLSKKL